MFFSIVIPARNEEKSIKKTVLNLLESLHKNSIDSEIIIVDDGSTDKTEEIVKAITFSEKIIKVNLHSNLNRYNLYLYS